MIALKAENVIKDFPVDEDEKIRVLYGVSTEIKRGELTMLIGPSGCGKTTLISILTGILSMTSGRVSILDQPLDELSDSQKVLFRRKHIGFIFQQFNLLTALTAAENAALSLIADGVEDRVAAERARDILRKIGMGADTEKLPRQLSGGQQQRVAIARALVHHPELIVCDEPTASLDAKTGHAVMEILRDVANESGRAVLVVSHDNRIYHFADRILEMADGRIVGDKKTAEFLDKGAKS